MKNIFITKTDLAMAYFPYIGERAARHKLMDLIKTNTALMKSLMQTGHQHFSRAFSPKQLELIYQEFGNPFTT